MGMGWEFRCKQILGKVLNKIYNLNRVQCKSFYAHRILYDNKVTKWCNNVSHDMH